MGREGESLLPDAVPAEGHEVVHAIVGLGHAGEDAGDALPLLGLGDGFKAKMCRAGGVGYGIIGGAIIRDRAGSGRGERANN